MNDADEVLRLRGAIREAMRYADRDDMDELNCKIWFTLHEALKTYEKPQRRRGEINVKSLADDLDKESLWGLITAQMAEQRENEAWQESVNVTRRKDRALAADELQAAADTIERELICCDEFERFRDQEDAERIHHICYWAGASRAIVLDRLAALKEREARGERYA